MVWNAKNGGGFKKLMNDTVNMARGFEPLLTDMGVLQLPCSRSQMPLSNHSCSVL